MSLRGSYEGSTLSHIEVYILCVLHHTPMVYILCMIHSVHTHLWINRVAGSNSGLRYPKPEAEPGYKIQARAQPEPEQAQPNFTFRWDP